MTSPQGNPTRIQVIYPHADHQIFEDSTFLMGNIQHAPSGTKLFINKEQVPVSKHGFFAWKIPIHAGMNPVRLEVRLNEATPPIAQNLFALRGVPPLSIFPPEPLKIHLETLHPAEEVWLSAADSLKISCSASEHVDITFTIPGWMETPVSVPPVRSEKPYLDTREVIFSQKHWTALRIPVRGAYEAQVPVAKLIQKAKSGAAWPQNAVIMLHLKHGSHSLQQAVPGRLTLLQQPKAAIAKQDRLITRTEPPNGSRLTPQRANTLFMVDGLEQGWAKVRLSQEDSFYIALDELTLIANPPHSSVPALASIQTEPVNGTESLVRLAFNPHPAHACPIQVESLPAERMNRLQVRLYGVSAQSDFIQYPPEEAVVRQIHWRQVAETILELWIDLHQPLAGYDYIWSDGEWQFKVRTLPKTLAETRILIDPGHGGAEWGSTGLNGLPEKNLNLTVSRLLRDALLKEGFQATLTRNTDVALSLQARGDQVLASQPHIALSLHHNALPDGRDPLKAVGACCFYYHAFSKPLAENLLAGLTESLPGFQPVPNYGLFDDSLYMTRIHQALAVLVEVGFFTQPDEFERLIQPEFQKQAAQRLAGALRRYCLGV